MKHSQPVGLSKKLKIYDWISLIWLWYRWILLFDRVEEFEAGDMKIFTVGFGIDSFPIESFQVIQPFKVRKNKILK